jgi:hypothetical protein
LGNALSKSLCCFAAVYILKNTSPVGGEYQPMSFEGEKNEKGKKKG